MLKDRFPGHEIITMANSLSDGKLPISDGLDSNLVGYIGRPPAGIKRAGVLGLKVMWLIINAFILRVFRVTLIKHDGCRALRELDGAKFLFFAGSGTLNQVYVHGVGALWLLTMLLGRILGKPIILIGQQIGPFEHGVLVRIIGRVLSIATYLGCRDQESVALASSLVGVRTQVRYSGDEGGYLPPASYLEGYSILNSVGVRPGFVAVHVRIDANCPFSPWLDRYAEIIDLVARTLGRQVLLVPMAYRGDHDDRVALRLLSSIMRTSCVLLECESPKLTKACLAHAALGIGVANHFVIFAASVGVPCISIHASEYMRQKLEGASGRFQHVRAYPVEGLQGETLLAECVGLAKPSVACEKPESFDPQLPEGYWDWLAALQESGVTISEPIER